MGFPATKPASRLKSGPRKASVFTLGWLFSDSDAEVAPAKARSFLRMFEWRRRTFSNNE